MAKYYLKILGPNELGSPDEDGHISRGRHIYVSKRYAGEFFPPLSKTKLNDFALIPVIPPFINEKVYLRYVYHNDKYILPDGSRDLYHLYFNKEIDPEGKYYQPGDIFILEKLETEDEVIPVYLIHKFSEISDSAIYKVLAEIISKSPVKNHALADELPFLNRNSSIERYEQSEAVIPDEIKAQIARLQRQILGLMRAGRNAEAGKKAEIFNSTNFRDTVLTAYGKQCAVTREVISWKKFNNLEAAHIKPRAHAGTFLPVNGIALSRDLHWAFDKGLFTVNNSFKVVVHSELKHTSLQNYHDKEIIIPEAVAFRPLPQFLSYHNRAIFGLFRKTGAIRRLLSNK
jgi:hypothetical protein